MTMTDVPTTPSSRDLWSLNEQVAQMNLDEVACNHAIGNAKPSQNMSQRDGNVDDDASSMFQTPSSSRRRKLSFVVTPPRIPEVLWKGESLSKFPEVNLLPPPTSLDEERPSSSGRKRTRGGSTAGQPAPMFPGSPEFTDAPAVPTLSSNNKDNVFGRHIPIHSPIAGVASTFNLEYMARLLEKVNTRSPSSASPIEMLEHGVSFLARHSFPTLEDEEQERVSNESRGTARALKMRRRCREEDFDDLLQAEKELLS